MLFRTASLACLRVEPHDWNLGTRRTLTHSALGAEHAALIWAVENLSEYCIGI